MREKTIEHNLVMEVKRVGGLALKFVSPGFDGVPDRLVLLQVVENHAEEIVQFKNGYFLTQPATYISRKGDEDGAKKTIILTPQYY